MSDKEFEFEILRISPVNDAGGEVRGFAEVRIGAVTIRSIRILQTHDEVFCAFPRETFFSQRLGRQIHRSLIHMPDDLRSRLYEEILKRWNRIEELKFKNEERGDEVNDTVQS